MTASIPRTTPPVPRSTPLVDISLVELLEADPRPTFVVSLASPGLPVVYYNPAWVSASALWDVAAVPREARHGCIWDGLAAATASSGKAAAPLAVVTYGGYSWTRTVLRSSMYAVVSANQIESTTPMTTEPTTGTDSATSPAPAVLTAPIETKSTEPTVTELREPTELAEPTTPIVPPVSTAEPVGAAGMLTPPASAVFSPSHAPKDNVAPTSQRRPPSAQSNNFYLDQIAAIGDFMPVGMSVFDPDGNVSHANDLWYTIMGAPMAAGASSLPLAALSQAPASAAVPKIAMSRSQFLSHIIDEDRSSVQQFFAQAARLVDSAINFRVKKIAPSPSDKYRDNYVLATAHSVTDSQGQLSHLLVCLRDISEHQHIAEAADRHAQQASNLRRMAEFATVGMYDMDTAGHLRGANRVFYEMCGFAGKDAEDFGVRPWLQCVEEEDQPLIQACLDHVALGGRGNWLETNKKLSENEVETENKIRTRVDPEPEGDTDHQTIEVRLKTPWTADDGAGGRIVAPHWVEATFLPVRDSDGKVQSITGCLSDVSLRRWQLERERQVKEEAIESKRQQENFVDITSHEIRNPLTVIMHCGDAALEGLTKLRDNWAERQKAEGRQEEMGLLEDAIDYAEIIVSSALHQKSIVDDILTMSKLDSDLLVVTPVIVDPLELVRSTLRMFEVQARQQHIQLRMVVKSSYYKELTSPGATAAATPFLVLDPSRVKQILINLLTNALKFTQQVDVREVITTVSVSRTRPTDTTCAVSFVPRPQQGLSPASAPSSPTSPSSLPLTPSSPPAVGDPVFLIFEVSDTGEGLTKDGMESLFQKFVQANSRTHVKHGGSGLGLFISKRLAEIQNGAIGVASKPGIGSTFVFYIEAYIPPTSAVPELLSPGEAAKQALAVGLGNVARAGSSMPTPPTKTVDLTGGPTLTTVVMPPLGLATPAPLPVAALISTPVSAASALASSPTTTDIGPTPPAQTPSLHTGDATSAANSQQLATVSATPPEIRGVLLVEDNMINQKVTRRYFEKCGFHVEVAANGIEAMACIRTSDRCVPGAFPISVVLMDMEMPVQDGLTCTRHIRSLEASGAFAGGRLPVLMITGNARPEQIADALAAGCDDVVVKPFQMQMLFEHMEAVMNALWKADRQVEETEATEVAPEGEAGEAEKAETVETAEKD